MYRKIINSCKIEFKNLVYKRFNIIAMILLIMYSFYIYFSIKGIDSLRANSYGIISVFIIMMYIGYSLGSEEYSIKCNDVFDVIGDTKPVKMIAKLIVGIMIIFLLAMIDMIILFLTYYMTSQNGVSYEQSIIFYLIYYIPPAVVFLTIGLVIGDKIKYEISYLIMFLICLLFTAFNEGIFSKIYLATGKSMDVLSWLMTNGLYTIHAEFYNNIYGFKINDYDAYKELMYISIVFLIFTVLYLKEHKNIFKIISTFLIASLFVSCINIYINKDIININAISKYGLEYERKLYENNEIVYEDINYSMYSINSIDIEIDDTYKILATVDLVAHENTDKLLFSLYQGLDINSIYDTDNNKLKFNREKDIVEVKLEESLLKGKELKLKFEYEGNFGSQYFLNNKGIYLNSSFPYIPSNIIDPVFNNYNAFGMIMNRFNTKSDYKVKINSSRNIFSNLEKTGENTFEGNSKDGLFLLSGDVVKQGEYKGIEYYISDRYINDNMSENDIHKFIDDYEKINNKIEKIIGEDIYNPLSKIFIIEWRDIGGNDVVDILDDSMIIKTIEGNFPYLEEVILPGIISESLQHNNSSLEYLVIEGLFIQTIRDYLYGYEYMDMNMRERHRGNDSKLFNEVYYESSKSIKKILSSDNDEKKNMFISEYYNILKNKDVDTENLKNLISRYI
ncbi:MAG: hypothetical protein ACRDD7_01845 [Peptostreptococcaceae bacterium]